MNKYITVFKAIKNFINDLYREFADESIPLERYKRLQIRGECMIGKSVAGFKEFFKICDTTYFDYGLTTAAIPEGVHIRYEGNVYIDVLKFIGISTSETRWNIRKHLLYISILLKPNERKNLLLKEVIEPEKEPPQTGFWLLAKWIFNERPQRF